MKTKLVIVTEYQKEWKDAFNKIKEELLDFLKSKIIGIEHVGSTSVEGLMSKPIIDLDIIIQDNFDEVKHILEKHGYTHEGDLGIPTREAFKYNGKAHLMKHHLYVCNHDSPELKRHIMFRDYLRKSYDDMISYGNLKKKLAETYPQDVDKYIEGKSDFIRDIYKKCNCL